MKHASASEVRAAIAMHALGEPGVVRTLGAVTLLEHQVLGAERVRNLLEVHGGSLLADDVGLGKTYTALAVARDARNPLVLGPAAVRHVWARASEATGVKARFASFEQLGRGCAPPDAPDLVIVDEAHHLRSRTTRRFAGACRVCAGARVLLLSATPVQNRIDDLRAILSLFLGERAMALSVGELAAFVVRRTELEIGAPALSLPSASEPRWLETVEDVDCLDRLVSLPPPLPPSGGADGGVLLTFTLVRQWASSRGALCAALHRRVARAHAMEDALRAGRIPSRAELQSWCFADGAQQLAFPELMAGAVATDSAALLKQVRVHTDAIRDMLNWLRTSPDPDPHRAATLRDVLRRHPGERVVAFSEYSDTVSALFRLLAPTSRCALLTHAGGRLSSGAISRREVLEQFQPAGRRDERERIDLLLSTDVLSEGVSLHGASVVVHLDLAWNPARLEQRVGRVRRIGSARDLVTVYVMRPPAPAERLLEMERRLQVKLGGAARSIGVAGAILPGLAQPRAAATVAGEEGDAILRSWRGSMPSLPAIAAVRSVRRGAVVAVRHVGASRLLAIRDGQVTAAREDVHELLTHADGADVPASEERVRGARDSVDRWLRRHSVSNVVDLAALRVARSRRALLRRVDVITRRAPRHVQPVLAPLVNAARSAATATLSAGAERVLDELSHATMRDDAWLRAVGEFAALHARDPDEEEPEIVAILLLEPE